MLASLTGNQQGDLTMNSTTTRKLFWLALIATITLVCVSLLLASLHSSNALEHSLIFFDEDLSESVLGWMIAIPVLMLAFVVVLVALAGAGVVLAIVFAMLLLMGLVAAVFGVLMALIPVAAFLAVPALIIWGTVKFCRRNVTPTAV